MDKFIIEGGRPLRGTLRVSGSKNAALPILIATLLTDEPCLIENVPKLRDIKVTIRLLEHLGKKAEWENHRVLVLARSPLKTRAPYDLVKQMRASVLVAGPLLARFHQVKVPLPGGCAIGLRPINLHLEGFARLGAEIGREGGDVLLTAGSLRGKRVRLSFPSVGATENLLMAAVLCPGTTLIENAAREPEISDLAGFLKAMGARIQGEGSSSIEVRGVSRLHGADYKVICDRIEAGTFLIAAAASGGDLVLEDVLPRHLEALIRKLRQAGAGIELGPGRIRLKVLRPLKAVSVTTRPHPGFPTDLQAPWTALMSLAGGKCVVHETVFEKRFLHAAELARMGASLSVRGDKVFMEGGKELYGAPVMASDIRAGAALLVAALAARGRTELQRVYHIDRGYEAVEKRLRKLGASIRRVGGVRS